MPSLADLIRMGKQYIGDAMPGGSLNPETAPVARQANYLSGILDPASQVSQDATNWHKRTQIGLKDQLAGRQTPEAEQAYQTMMMAAGMAPIGMTAWHGSPHKFDKFSLDKIGTGEGAQAYGHGLYLAESPGVAKTYQVGGQMGPEKTAQYYLNMYKTPESAIEALQSNIGAGSKEAQAYSQSVIDLLKSNKVTTGQLYKTDIPDEAVARFLDWDKPLSQQAPEVRGAVIRAAKSSSDPWISGWGKTWEEYPSATGSEVYKSISNRLGNQNKLAFDSSPEVPDTSAMLRAAGIPGIRYLDGGSRSAGQGSSNFVAFDPEMIRILERNGQATGLEPWKPGEYRLKDLIGKE